MQGGMGAPETVPFSSRTAADKFAAEHGGQVVMFDSIPRDYVLGSEPAAAGTQRFGAEAEQSRLPRAPQ
jgi:copper chaperone NosL